MKPIYDAMHAMNPDVTLGVNIPWYDTSEAGDQALLNWILKHYVHSHHWFGTNSMKPYADGGVVDSSGHVYGTQNLVVADVSIFPLKVSCVACSFIPQAYVHLSIHTQLDGNTGVPGYIAGQVIGRKLANTESHKEL